MRQDFIGLYKTCLELDLVGWGDLNCCLQALLLLDMCNLVFTPYN